MRAPATRVTVLSDFDGTITLRDTNEALADRWLGASARESFRRQLFETSTPLWQVLDASLSACGVPLDVAIDHLKEHIDLDPHFTPFVHWCESRGWALCIVSAGLHEVIEALLARDGLHLPIVANRARLSSGGFGLVPAEPGCPTGVDKAAVVQAARAAGAFTVFIGDGLSDRLAVPHADLVFAKGALTTHCARGGIPHTAVEGFAEIQKHLVHLTR